MFTFKDDLSVLFSKAVPKDGVCPKKAGIVLIGVLFENRIILFGAKGWRNLTIN